MRLEIMVMDMVEDSQSIDAMSEEFAKAAGADSDTIYFDSAYTSSSSYTDGSDAKLSTQYYMGWIGYNVWRIPVIVATSDRPVGGSDGQVGVRGCGVRDAW